MKKGAIQVETIIVIILALLALVIVAAAFTGGFNNLWTTLMGFTPSVTEDAAKTTCSGLCTPGSTQFCSKSFVITGKESEGAKKCPALISCAQVNCP